MRTRPPARFGMRIIKSNLEIENRGSGHIRPTGSQALCRYGDIADMKSLLV